MQSEGPWRPGLAPQQEPRPALRRLEVDGEVFELRAAPGGGTHYDWISGPNEGYGFSANGPTEPSVEEHEEQIRAFLGMIDPATGYIADD